MEHKEGPPPYGLNAPPDPHQNPQYPPQYPQQPQYAQYPPYPPYPPPPPHNGPPMVYAQPPLPPAGNQPPPVVHVVTTGVTTVPGTCPVCHAGSFESSVTCCGICCCILFFPIGLLCLFCMMEKKCSHCGYTP